MPRLGASRHTGAVSTCPWPGTACLSLEDRLTIDRAIAGDPDAFAGYSDRVVIAEVRKLAARLEPAAVAKRRRRAESERRVTIRPAPATASTSPPRLPPGRRTPLGPDRLPFGCIRGAMTHPRIALIAA
jgi:hypothetical protein